MHKHASENSTMNQPKGDKCSNTTLQRTTQSRSRPRVSFNTMAEVNVIEEVLPVTTKLLLRGHGDGIIIVRPRSSRWNYQYRRCLLRCCKGQQQQQQSSTSRSSLVVAGAHWVMDRQCVYELDRP